jgi:UDP-N-acetylmuramate dehydrogenase
VRELRDVPLSARTTLRLGGPAHRLVETQTEEDLVEVVTRTDRAAEPLLVLGGGSNLVVGDGGFAGTVAAVGSRGVDVRPAGADRTGLVVAAGEPWDALVERSVTEGWAGIEALSGIPGLVGATPVQNVGAYGQEVAETVVGVRVLDRSTGAVGTLTAADCGFGYRHSVFRGADRWVVLSVHLRLRRSDRSGPVRYAELARVLDVPVGGTAPLAEVREAVLGLRRAKGMVLDPADPDTVSAGSFFTNPVLDPPAAAVLPPDAPRWPAADGRVKVSAAWLIEQAGFRRGQVHGTAAISTKHTLALVNRGGTSADDLLVLAREVRDGVRARFGVELSPEPLLVGCSLD